MKTQFAIFDGQTLVSLINATDVLGAVKLYVMRIMRNEYQMVKNENGKMLTTANMQACYDDWCDTAIENMRNDGCDKGQYIISIDDMIDNWSNRAWIVELNPLTNGYDSIGNKLQYNLILDLFRTKEIIEREFTI